MSSLKGKVIWITGASTGIGEALAYQLAEKGAKLILSARRKTELDRVKANCPIDTRHDVRTIALDLSLTDTLQRATEHALECFGHVDVLINNGGIRVHGLVNETSLALDRQIMETNYFGTIALTKCLLSHFVQRKQGHYVIVSSITGKFGTPYRSAYAASKHALHGFYDALRAEHFSDFIFVTVVCPGFINTAPPVAVEGMHQPSRPNDRKPVGWCAGKIISAIERKKEEVNIGGKEVWMVYVKRFFPSLFAKMIRKISVR